MLEKINKLANWQVFIIIIIIGFAVYATGLNGMFQGDDQAQIVNNTLVHSISNFPHFFQGGSMYSPGGGNSSIGSYYRPLMTTAYSLIYSLFGPHPFYFHLLQLLLCIGSTCILYLIFRYSFGVPLALALALAFLLHPINSQVVFAIPSLEDALYFFWGILGLYLLMRLPAKKYLAITAVCFLLSVLSKETGVLIILISGLYVFWWDKKRLAPFATAMALVILAWLLLKAHAGLIGSNPNNAPIDNLGLTGRLMNGPSILLFYFTKFIFPWKLATAYYWAYPHFSIRHMLIPILIDLGVIALFIYFGRIIRAKAPVSEYYTYLFFAVWFCLGVATTLQIFRLDMTVCETWIYFSMAGLLGMIGTIVKNTKLPAITGHGEVLLLIVVAGILLMVLGLRTAIRGTNYHSPFLLALHDASASKEDYIAETTLANHYLVSGDYQSSESYALDAVRVFPGPVAYNALGQSYIALDEYSNGVQAFKQGMRYGVYYPLYESLAEVDTFYGNLGENAQFIKQAVQYFPRDGELWFYLAIVEYKLNNMNNAKYAIEQAYAYSPTESPIGAVYYNLENNIPLNLKFKP